MHTKNSALCARTNHQVRPGPHYKGHIVVCEKLNKVYVVFWCCKSSLTSWNSWIANVYQVRLPTYHWNSFCQYFQVLIRKCILPMNSDHSANGSRMWCDSDKKLICQRKQYWYANGFEIISLAYYFSLWFANGKITISLAVCEMICKICFANRICV
jgi:hypothetical protein